MKKATAILLILLMTLCVTCCQKQDQPESDRKIEDQARSLGDFEPLSQLPELPTGCEVTSLVMTLRYYGIDADKCDIADNYLKKGEIDMTDPRAAFVGDPRDEDSYGCYAPVIVDAADRYLISHNVGYLAKDMTGTELKELFSYIDSGDPVIVWGTLDCQDAEVGDYWEADGEIVYWVYPEHCMVLVGYDEDEVFLADPMKGRIVTFDRDRFEKGYHALYRQAIVIKKTR